MAGIEVKVESNKDAFLTALKSQVEKALETVRLRSSVAHATDEGEKAVYIGSNLEYAVYNEVGTGIYAEGGGGRKDPWVYVDDKGVGHRTVGMKPIHFLKRAAEENRDEYMRAVEEALKS